MADEQVVEQPKFNAIEHIQQANEAEAARRNGKPVVPPIKQAEPAREAKSPESEEEKDKRISRSDRRRLKYVEEAAEERGRRLALEQVVATLGTKSEAPPPTGTDDPEPQRSQYGSDAEHQRALGRWDARQEAKKEVSKVKEESTAKEQREQWETHLREMDAKCLEDIKTIPGWAEHAKQASENEDLDWDTSEHPTLFGLISSSDMKAFVLDYFSQHSDEFQKMLKMTSDTGSQIRAFARLEGRIEKMYSSDEPNKPAAQAVEETLKDRTHPAEAKAGRNSAERDASKPRPSTEVAARGGSAPPSDLRIGSPEWHQRENERERANRGR